MSPMGLAGQGALAVLREPTPEEASRWYQPRKLPAVTRMQGIVDFFLEEKAGRVVKRSDACAEIVVTSPSGTTLRLALRPEEYTVRVGPSLVVPGKAAPKRPASDQYVVDIVQVLQIGSGFYVFSDDLVSFEPIGACPACDVEVYEWQDECEACSAKVHPLVPGEDEHDGRSRRVVECLMRRGMIELCSPRGRRNVEKTVAGFYAYGSAPAEVLLGMFMDMADIAEVYCDDDELHQVLLHVR